MTQFSKRAAQATKPASPAKSKKPSKVRKNIMLSQTTIALGKKLAHQDHRNFSNLIETLMVREAARLGVV